MATTAPRKQHIKVRETQLEIPNDRAAITEDFENKLATAQTQLAVLQKQRTALERETLALEDLNQRKQEFLNGQVELSERYSSAITSIDRDLFESKQDIEDLEQTRKAFANQLKRIESLNPESWPKKSLDTELEKALTILDKAEDEYEQAAEYFGGTKKGAIFGGSSSSHRRGSQSDFHTTFRNGIAFNLPLIVLGSLALLIYLLK